MSGNNSFWDCVPLQTAHLSWVSVLFAPVLDSSFLWSEFLSHRALKTQDKEKQKQNKSWIIEHSLYTGDFFIPPTAPPPTVCLGLQLTHEYKRPDS